MSAKARNGLRCKSLEVAIKLLVPLHVPVEIGPLAAWRLEAVLLSEWNILVQLSIVNSCVNENGITLKVVGVGVERAAEREFVIGRASGMLRATGMPVIWIDLLLNRPEGDPWKIEQIRLRGAIGNCEEEFGFLQEGAR